MFLLKKLIKPFFLPSTFILLVLGIGALFIILSKRKRLGKYFLLAGTIFYYLFSIEPVSDLLITPLENRYPPLNIAEAMDAKYIVALAGANINNERSGSSKPQTLHSERFMEAVSLYFLMDEPKIVFSGGSGNPFFGVKSTEQLIDFLTKLGIKKDKVRFEIESRDTYENGVEVKRLIGDQKFIFVTSADHMPRAMAVFKKLNMKPIPAPCDYQAGRSYTLLSFFPSGGNLEISTRAINEYLGIIWYRLRGRISA